MVGCGNSKMSAEMARDGYPLIDNMDVSDVVLKQMYDQYSSQHSGFEFTAMDATKMNYRDNSFDVCIDKGTFDALACGPDRSVICNLTKEMMRVCKEAVVVITSGTPDRRMSYFNEFLEGQFSSIEHHQLETSQLAQLINILRTDLKDKPLSYAVKNDPEILKRALLEMQRIKKERELAEGAKTDPRKKLLLLMMRARNLKLREKEEADA